MPTTVALPPSSHTRLTAKTKLSWLQPCISIFLLLTVPALRAATISWTNTVGGIWSNPVNWSPNIVPIFSDTVQIIAPGTYVVTVDTSVTIANLTLGGASGSQTLTNAAQTI